MAEENAGGEQNGAVLNDPVDVIIDKLLRYDFWYTGWHSAQLFRFFGSSLFFLFIGSFSLSKAGDPSIQNILRMRVSLRSIQHPEVGHRVEAVFSDVFAHFLFTHPIRVLS